MADDRDEEHAFMAAIIKLADDPAFRKAFLEHYQMFRRIEERFDELDRRWATLTTVRAAEWQEINGWHDR